MYIEADELVGEINNIYDQYCKLESNDYNEGVLKGIRLCTDVILNQEAKHIENSNEDPSFDSYNAVKCLNNSLCPFFLIFLPNDENVLFYSNAQNKNDVEVLNQILQQAPQVLESIDDEDV